MSNASLRAGADAEPSAGPRQKTVLVTLGVATVLFVLLAIDVARGGRLTLLDARTSIWLHIHNSPYLTPFLLWVSKLHSNLSITIVTAVIAAYLWARRLRYWVLTLVISVFGGMVLNIILKSLFARARPHFDNPIVVLRTFSFPSGHTLLATVFYGTLCVLIFSRLRNRALRAIVVLLAMSMVALVGFSRMYLGVHYLTDVLGATLEGIAWVALVLLAVQIIRQRNQPENN